MQQITRFCSEWPVAAEDAGWCKQPYSKRLKRKATQSGIMTSRSQWSQRQKGEIGTESTLPNLRAVEATIDESKYEADPKALTIYSKPSYEVLGKVDRKTSKFDWNEQVVTAVGSTVEDLEKAAL